MVFNEQIKLQINSQAKRCATIITLLISGIILTPLCGFFFQCGCQWPGLGLDSLCNYHQPHAEHQCPWCASLITGIFSSGMAICTGILASRINLNSLTKQHPFNEIIIRIGFGITIFVLMAMIFAVLAALWQGYPLLENFSF